MTEWKKIEKQMKDLSLEMHRPHKRPIDTKPINPFWK